MVMVMLQNSNQQKAAGEEQSLTCLVCLQMSVAIMHVGMCRASGCCELHITAALHFIQGFACAACWHLLSSLTAGWHVCACARYGVKLVQFSMLAGGRRANQSAGLMLRYSQPATLYNSSSSSTTQASTAAAS
jgi:hypothetical protein